MDKRKRVYKWIHIGIVVGSFLSINIIAWTLMMSNDVIVIETLNFSNMKEIILPILSYYVFSILIFIFSPFGLAILIYIIYRVVHTRTIRKNEEHPKFDLKYFREDLKQISPSVVSYLVDFTIDIDRDVPAHLLKLQLDGYIEEQNGKFIVTGKSDDSLKNSDKILLNLVTSDFKNTNKLSEYKNAVTKEMVADKYIQYTMTKKDIIQLFSTLIILPLLLVCLLALSTLVIGNSSSTMLEMILGITMVIILCIFSFEPIIFIVRLILFIKYGKIKRTAKGNKLLEQIYGLKNFLSDFTNLDDSTIKEVYLREYYLVYAVVLKVNDIVDDEILLKIKEQIHMTH